MGSIRPPIKTCTASSVIYHRPVDIGIVYHRSVHIHHGCIIPEMSSVPSAAAKA